MAVPSVGMASDFDLVAAASANHHLVTPTIVVSCGISRRRWQRWQDTGLWVQVTPTHFRHAATPLTFEMQVRAGSEWLGGRGALFGTTALAWLGVEVPPPQWAEFLVTRADRSIPNWMIVHTSSYWTPRRCIHHRGVRTTTAARAIVDFASLMPSARDLEAAIDGAVRTRRTAMTQLRQELSHVSRRGRRGLVLLRELLLDSGVESYLERRFMRLVRHQHIARPKCQVVFKNRSHVVARVDFIFGLVVVEVSGRLGHASDRERQKDARRRNELQQQGLTVLEFTTADVIDDPTYVLTTLRRSLDVAS